MNSRLRVLCGLARQPGFITSLIAWTLSLTAVSLVSAIVVAWIATGVKVSSLGFFSNPAGFPGLPWSIVWASSASSSGAHYYVWVVLVPPSVFLLVLASSFTAALLLQLVTSLGGSSSCRLGKSAGGAASVLTIAGASTAASIASACTVCGTIVTGSAIAAGFSTAGLVGLSLLSQGYPQAILLVIVTVNLYLAYRILGSVQVGARPATTRRTLIVALTLLVVAIAVTAGVLAWSRSGEKPRPAVNGVECEESFSLVVVEMKIKLRLFDEGREVPVPANIGIYPECSYWIHTHESNGIVYVESPVARDFTLGDFLAIWGVNITREEFLGKPVTEEKSLYVYVDGRPYRGDPRDIKLRDGMEIIISYGEPVKSP